MKIQLDLENDLIRIGDKEILAEGFMLRSYIDSTIQEVAEELGIKLYEGQIETIKNDIFPDYLQLITDKILEFSANNKSLNQRHVFD